MNKKFIAGIEIFLVISMAVSFSWILGNIYGTSPDIKSLLEFITIIPSVSAQTTTSCCLNLKSGASCTDIPSDSCSDICDGNCVSGTTCSQLRECNLGCGFNSDEGTCTPNTPRVLCEGDEGCEFLDDPFCNNQKCEIGCCVLGLSANLETRTGCEIQSLRRGVSFEFDSSIKDGVQCLNKGKTSEGACVVNFGEEKNNCIFTTQSECVNNIKGVFYEGYLCSHPELKTICVKQSRVSCFDNRDEVYWYDSCGNRENIYSSNRASSWNNGFVLSKEKSCNPNSSNENSGSCGNCNYNLGSICGEFRPGVDSGNMEGYTCRNLNCIDSKGKQRTNGESWCVYDGTIGGGSILEGKSGGLLSKIAGGLLEGEVALLSTDLVGSRHFRQVCVNGKVEVEPCADYRKEICVQNDKSLDNGRKIDNAICRMNLWEQCISYNQGNEGCGPGCLTKCVKNPDCRIHPVFVDSRFKFNACVPKYPPGFDLGSTSGVDSFVRNYVSSSISDLDGGGVLSKLSGSLSSENSAGSICSLASQKCTSIWTKTCGLSGIHWECTKNCKCHTESFTIQMNNLCVSLGDCGVYANYEGKVTPGGAYVTKKGGHGRTPLQPFILIPVYAVLVKILKPTPPSGGFFRDEKDIVNFPTEIIDPFLGGYNRIDVGKLPSQLDNMLGSQLGTTIGAGVAGGLVGGVVAGLGGVTAAGLGVIGAATQGILWAPILFPTGGVGMLPIPVTFYAPTNNILSTVFHGHYLGKPFFGFDPLSIAIGIAVGIAITYLIGCGKVKTVDIKFQCLPWQRPKGGTDCEKCDDDPLKPCSRYRCESLGARCTLINEGKGDVCVSVSGESSIPVISPWEEILNTSFYRYEDISPNGFKIRTKDGQCIQAFTYLVFGVETDVYSECFWSLEPFAYENKSEANLFLEGNLLTKNHTMLTLLPSVESLLANEINNQEELGQALETTTEQDISARQYILNRLGDLNIYVKCANLDGKANDQDYKINFCVSPGPDIQEPVIIASSPPQNNFTKFDATEQEAFFFISEPAECRWDSTRQVISNELESYNSLRNEMECSVDLDESTILGWPCNATLPITGEENRFFIQCRDQPWLGNNNSRNIGDIFEYSLKRSNSELKITSIKPNEKVFAGSEPIMIELEVETSGGVENGNAFCKYSFDNNQFVNFRITGEKVHSQILNQMRKGDYKVYIQCNDFAGNVAEGIGEFSLELDTKAPVITRVFSNANTLFITTDEEAKCFYKNESDVGCNFPLNNVTEFNITEFTKNGNIHSTPLIKGKSYYIKCEDIWSNRAESCSIVVRSFENFAS